MLERFEACKAGDWVKAKAVSDAYVLKAGIMLTVASTPTPRPTTSSRSMPLRTTTTMEDSHFRQTLLLAHRHLNLNRSSGRRPPVFLSISFHLPRPGQRPSTLRSPSQLLHLHLSLSDKIQWRSSISPCAHRHSRLCLSSSRRLRPLECLNSDQMDNSRSLSNKHQRRTLLPTLSTSCRSLRNEVVI